ERRWLARARRDRDEHGVVLESRHHLRDHGQVVVAPLRGLRRDDAHDYGVRAALHEDVHSEAREARRAERKVGRAELVEVLARRLVVADYDARDARGVRGQELFEAGNLYGLKLSHQLDLRRATGREDEESFSP